MSSPGKQILVFLSLAFGFSGLPYHLIIPRRHLGTGNDLVAALLHASHNAFMRTIFDRMAAPVGRTLHITTELGAGSVLTMGNSRFLFLGQAR